MEWELLSSLDPEAQRVVLSATRRRSFAKREVVFHEGDPGDTLHLIEKGTVAVRVTTPAGDTATVTVLGAGAAFGELALLRKGSARSGTVQALEPTVTLSLQREEFHRLRRANPGVEEMLTLSLAESVDRLSQHLLEALYVSVDKRVRRRLLSLAELYESGSKPITIPLTQDDIAGLAGATRPTVNQVLKSLEERGVIALGRGRLEVLDPVLLSRLAQ